MAEQEKWKWQEPGTTWKGIGLYHITLTVTDRQPLLGVLAVPENDPTRTRVVRTALGNALVNCLLSIQRFHPEVQVLHFCLMPDHLHAVLYVRHIMPTGIGAVVRGFWQAAKKLGRAYSAASCVRPNDIRQNFQEEGKLQILHEEGKQLNFHKEGNLRENTALFEAFSAALRERMGDDVYYRLAPIFTEMPFIRPMGRNTQLPNTIRYIDMNPQRLATKRMKPGYFRVQRDITIGERSYDGVGNTMLLMGESYDTVHVHRELVEAAKHGNNEPLRNYMNSCVLKARKGTIMVSPFISTQEKQVMHVLLREQLPFICLTDNGFRDYYKPTDAHFDACASGRLLILSPWPYDAEKRHISRADCIALNAMAEEICSQLVNCE